VVKKQVNQPTILWRLLLGVLAYPATRELKAGSLNLELLD
jgi:hypothetical protein